MSLLLRMSLKILENLFLKKKKNNKKTKKPDVSALSAWIVAESGGECQNQDQPCTKLSVSCFGKQSREALFYTRV